MEPQKVCDTLNVENGTEKRLRESELQLQTILETSPQGILVLSPAGDIMQINSAGLCMLDAENAEMVLGTNAYLYIAPEDRETYQAFHNSVCQGNSATLEFDIISLAGGRRSLFCTSAPFRNSEGTTLHLAIVEDISKRKAGEAKQRVLESQLRQSQKMEAIGRLASGVVHDFNNLLMIILNSCDEIQSHESLSSKGTETLDNIQQASLRAVVLIRQLLAFSRKQQLNPVVLNLNEIIANIHKMALRLIGEDIELIWRPFPALWPAKLDAGQFEQVVLNLIVNARDAMPQGGQLKIETANVEWTDEDCRSIPDRKPGRYAMLRISDTGIGIPLEVQSRIFEPFFTTKEAGAGTGLGLSVVHDIVKQNNGHIDVDSRVDVATSFMVYFPAVKEHTAISPQGKSMLPQKRGTETVLLVEDEEDVRKIVRLALEKQGYTVIEASNGQEALAAAESYPSVIEIVLADVVLPVMSGRQLSKLLTTRFPGIKVIYMTGYTDDAILRQGLRHDSHALLQKPFTMLELVQKVQTVLSEKPLDILD